MTVRIENVNLDLVHELSKYFYLIPMHATKIAGISNWQHRHGDNKCNGDINWTQYSAAGMLLGHESPIKPDYVPVALDFDTYSPFISKKMLGHIEKAYGQKVPYRVGQAPKFLVLSYVPIGAFPRKLKTNKYADSKGRTNQLELLTKGQFVGIIGKITDKADVPHIYTWNNVSAIDESIVITLTVEQIEHLMEVFEELCISKDLHLESKSSSAPGQIKPDTDEDDFDISISDIKNEPLDFSNEEVRTLLMDYPAKPLDYDDWAEVGFALSHQYNNDEFGYKLWLEWSKLSPEHNPKYMLKKWKSFTNEKDKNVTLRTIIHRADRQPTLDVIDTPVTTLIKNEAAYAATDNFLNEPWIIEGLIRDNELAMVFGKPGEGKTFYSLDMLCHISRGISYQGNYTEARPVVYIAAEAALGVRKRLMVWRDYFGESACDNFYLTEIAVPLTNKRVLQQLINEIEALNLEKPIICFDTLAAVSGGLNENDTKDMNNATGLFRKLINKLDGTIMVVHHSGRGDADRARGSSVLDGAMDVIIKIEKDDSAVVEARITKIKDGEGLDLKSKIFHSMVIGKSNVTGNPVTSAVLIDAAEVFDDDDEPMDSRLIDIQEAIGKVPMEHSLYDLLGCLFDDNPVVTKTALTDKYISLADIDNPRSGAFRRNITTALTILSDCKAIKLSKVGSRTTEIRAGKAFTKYPK